MDGSPTGARLELRGVVRTHRTLDAELRALDGVDLVVEPSSVVALCGPSGSGKSTLLHLVGGLDSADGGEVVVDGTALAGLRPAQLSAHRRRMGFVFQRFNLLPALSARDNVLAPTLPFRVAFDRRERADELLAAVGLGGREQALPAELSGGQQQRVAIARALVNDPAVLLADEPTGSLDSVTGDEVLALLLDLRRRRGATLLIATHDAAVAARCDRVVTLGDGRVVDDADLRSSDLDAVRRRLSGAT